MGISDHHMSLHRAEQLRDNIGLRAIPAHKTMFPYFAVAGNQAGDLKPNSRRRVHPIDRSVVLLRVAGIFDKPFDRPSLDPLGR
jgi:hypothetical protein